MSDKFNLNDLYNAEDNLQEDISEVDPSIMDIEDDTGEVAQCAEDSALPSYTVDVIEATCDEIDSYMADDDFNGADMAAADMKEVTQLGEDDLIDDYMKAKEND